MFVKVCLKLDNMRQFIGEVMKKWSMETIEIVEKHPVDLEKYLVIWKIWFQQIPINK